ncbi:DUF423 domain-containing protein [Segetibacter koreensis]|uniref:DUF423 domain-containing protein n=1 Tax=Segetibacter koreensis TaxID=398037 RepID=UPI000371CE01|nr:DUF423 domain-containing protein [Segetibacter koreensis]
MHKFFLQLAAVMGALAVALGAFGAHALKRIVPEAVVNIFETGVRYQFYHVFALAVIGILYRDFSNKWMLWAGNLFIIGIILFSGSLYMLTWLKASSKEGLDWVGIITPFGGLAFIAGWVCMFVGLYKTAVI